MGANEGGSGRPAPSQSPAPKPKPLNRPAGSREGSPQNVARRGSGRSLPPTSYSGQGSPAAKPKVKVKPKPLNRPQGSTPNTPPVPLPPSPVITAAKLALLKTLTSPKAAGQAGAAIGTGLKVAKGLGQQEGQALANERAAKQAAKAALKGGGVAGDVGDTLDKLGGAIANPTGPLGSSGQGLQRVKTATSLANDAANTVGLGKLGKAIANPGGPLASTGMGPKRIQNAVDRSSEAANTAVSALRKAGITKQVQGQIRIKAPGPAGKAQTAGLNLGAGGGKIAENAVKNAIEFPAMSAQSAYQIATKPQQTLKGYLKTGFLPALATGHIGEAAKRFEKNPLFSVAEVKGAVAVPGRAAGAVGRNVPGADWKVKPTEGTSVSSTSGAQARPATPGVPNLPGKIRQIASTKRPPLKLTPGQHETRHYSPDLIVKGAQVAREKLIARKGMDPHQAQGAQLARKLRGRANAQVELSEVQRRSVRAKEQAAAETPQAPTKRMRVKTKVTSTVPGVKVKPIPVGTKPPVYADGVVHAISEGRVRELTFRADLVKALKQYRAEQPSLKGARLTENKRNIRSLDLASKDPNLEQHISSLLKAGRETGQVTRAHGNELAAHGIYDKAQVARARLIPYAVTHMGAKHVEVKDASGAVTGHRLEVPTQTLFSAGKKTLTRAVPNAEIEAHMKANGVQPKDVGFISHNPRAQGSRNYAQIAKLTRGGGRKAKRTGEATRQGTMPTGYQSVVDQRVGGAGKVQQVKSFDRMMNEMGVKPEKGTWKTPEAAQAEADRRTTLNGESIPGAPKYRVINMHPTAGLSNEQLQMIHEQQGGSGRLSNVDRLTNEKAAMASSAQGKGEYRLIPEAQYNQVLAHAQGRNTFGKAVGSVTQQFRGAVLPFSPKWLAGNVIEEYGIRLPSYGVGPRTGHFGHQVINALEKQDKGIADEFTSITHQGRLYGSTPRTMVHSGAEQFRGTALEGTADKFATARRAPAVKQVLDKLKGYQNKVFKFNSKIEGGGELGTIGKVSKQVYSELGDFGQSWLKTATMGAKAADMVAGRIKDDPNLKFEFAKQVDVMLGKYSGFGPELRYAIQTYAPFLPWYLNSIRFVYWTLPVHHPIKTAVLVAGEEALQHDYEHSTLPDTLRGALKTPKGGLLDISHFTPFGAFSDPANFADVVLPQIGSAQKGLAGQDFTGREVKVPTGKVGPRGGKQTRSLTTAEKLELAANSAAESLLPGLRIARTVEEGGKTPQPNSYVYSPKTKPKTSAGSLNLGPVSIGPTLNKILNPLRPVHLKPPKGKKPKKVRVKRGRKPSSSSGSFPTPSGSGSSGNSFPGAGASSGSSGSSFPSS